MDDKQTTLIIALLSAPVAVAAVKVLELIVKRIVAAPPARRTVVEEAVALVNELQEEVQRLRVRVLDLERELDGTRRQLDGALAQIGRLERGQHTDTRSGPRPHGEVPE